jgi:regulator of sigma E protease
MIDESMDKEAMKLPPKPYEFRAKPAWQRLLIMIGGVLMNFLFAMIIYIGVLYAWGEQYLPTENVKYGIVVNEVGEEIGLQTGDKIISVDNQHVDDFYKVFQSVVFDEAKSIQVERNGQVVDVNITNEDLSKILKSKSIMSPRTPFKMQVEGFTPDSPGQEAGLQPGDIIKQLNGQSFEFFDEWNKELQEHRGEPITLTVDRDGVTKQVNMVLGEDGMIGIRLNMNVLNDLEWETINYGFFESIPAGIRQGVEITKDYLKQFKLFFRPETKAYESLGGFATIGSIFPGTWDWHAFWNMTAFISIILAIMNLLPIPALDGGHVMFLSFEMISGRKPGEKFMEYAQVAGMLLLLALVLYANANDIIKIINGTF